jgi:hypothetical protein
METFWKWLSQANAKRVLASSVLVFTLVAAYWTWREFSPPKRRGLPSSGSMPDDGDHGPLGLSVALADQPFDLPTNPFLPKGWQPPRPPVETPVVRPTRPTTVTRPAVRRPTVRRRPTVAPEKPAVAARAKGAEMVTLVYKGVFQGTDGKAMALIEDSKQQRTRFYKPGRDVLGLQVGDISTTEVTITNLEGEAVPVRLREPKAFELPARTD